MVDFDPKYAEIFNPKYSEIFKLDVMLTEAGIPHDFADEGWVVGPVKRSHYHIYYPSRAIWQSEERDFYSTCSVIEGNFSYGGDENLLEIMGLMTLEEREDYADDVIGSLTAEEVFSRIEKAWKKMEEKANAE